MGALLGCVVFMPWQQTKTLVVLTSRTALFSRCLPPRRHAFTRTLSCPGMGLATTCLLVGVSCLRKFRACVLHICFVRTDKSHACTHSPMCISYSESFCVHGLDASRLEHTQKHVFTRAFSRLAICT